jgi:hypothetical protein
LCIFLISLVPKQPHPWLKIIGSLSTTFATYSTPTAENHQRFFCLGLSSLERTIARQRLRIRFLADGDANTKYFHLLARGRKRRNNIVRIKDGNGNICTSWEEMEAAIHEHFQNVFGTPGSGAVTFDYSAVGIVPLDLSSLELPFTEEEVLAAVRDTPSDRAPGPDGFTGHSTKQRGQQSRMTSCKH